MNDILSLTSNQIGIIIAFIGVVLWIFWKFQSLGNKIDNLSNNVNITQVTQQISKIEESLKTITEDNTKARTQLEEITQTLSQLVSQLEELSQLNQKQEKQAQKEDKRLNDEISVTLVNDYDNTIELPVPIKRKDLTRAELMGRISMMKPGKRLNLDVIKAKRFLERIDEVATGTEKNFEIPISNEDYKQFSAE